MTTLTLLKARIADDLNRTDLTSQIANAITDAITHYQVHRFSFNDTRSSTFATVDGQSTYTSSDDADVPLFIELDGLFLNDATRNRPLIRETPEEMEWLLDSAAREGIPHSYSYFESSFRFYPIPDDVYTVRPIGLIEKAAPATDAETGNVWMTKAFELIRCRALWYVLKHTVQDFERAADVGGLDGESGMIAAAYRKLRKETSKKQGAGRIEATQF